MGSRGWHVALSKKEDKAALALPERVRRALAALLRDIEINGPVVNWPNYGKLSKNRHHCHRKKGSPTYVAVWEVRNKEIRIVEMTYVGTHEKAPY